MAMRRLFALLLVCSAFIGGIVLSRFTPALMAASTPEDVARNELHDWLNRIRSNYETYGFLSEDELDRAVVAEGLQVYNLPSSTIEQYQRGQKVLQIAKRPQEWEFPVLVDGNPRGMLRVAQFEGRLQAVEFGAKDYAEHLAKLRASLASGEDILALVKFYPTYSTFALIKTKGAKTITHVGSYAGVYPDLDREHFARYSDEEVLPKIKEALDEIKREVERRK